jgi:hypothetical protein
LHLRIAKLADKWTCAEINLTQSLGYGTYSFYVHNTSHLPPASVLSMLTWDDFAADPNHREMDIELSKWGNAQNKNSQYVIQPYYTPANVVRFESPAGPLKYSFHWEPGRVSFTTAEVPKARSAASRVIFDHAFLSGVPVPGNETVHITLYIFGFAAVPMQKDAEVVIDKFEYLP